MRRLGMGQRFEGVPALLSGGGRDGVQAGEAAGALIAVASRETCPTRRPPGVCPTAALCRCAGSARPESSAKAREKVAPLGISLRRDRPYGRRGVPSTSRRPLGVHVVGTPNWQRTRAPAPPDARPAGRARAAETREKAPDVREPGNRHEVPMSLDGRPGLFLEPRGQAGLRKMPESG